MRTLKVLLAAMALLSGPALSPASAQEKPCSSTQARAFDFWIGDWEIRQEILGGDGKWIELPARTSVRTSMDGCALVENWSGQVQFFWQGMSRPEPMTGLSVRAYDPQAAKWYIHWMDSRSPRFGQPYAGAFVDGVGEFTRQTAGANGPRLDRITFSPAAKDSVRWELAVSNDDGRTWRALWRMHMRRNSPDG